MFPELETHAELYRREFPEFARPRVLGFLSVDGERRARADTSRLQFLRRARWAGGSRVRLELERGRARAARRGAADERLAHLLQYLLEHEARLRARLPPPERALAGARFLCYRGLLTLLAGTPYEAREAWRVVAALHRGAVYLCARDTPAQRARLSRLTERDLQFTSWGYKFEQYLLSDSPNSEPDPSPPVNESEEFCLLFSNRLNQHRLVYAAEMDGIRCDKTHVEPPPTEEMGQEAIIEYLAKQEFIELKTSRRMENSHQENSFRRFKAKKWWCQSFLAGVDTIICGFRDDEGVVEELKVFNVRDLPKMCNSHWDPNVCFNFLDTFLTYVKRCLARQVARKYGEKALQNINSVPVVSLHFEWSPRQPVRVTDNYDAQADPILPPWFLDNYGKTPKEER